MSPLHTHKPDMHTHTRTNTTQAFTPPCTHLLSEQRDAELHLPLPQHGEGRVLVVHDEAQVGVHHAGHQVTGTLALLQP